MISHNPKPFSAGSSLLSDCTTWRATAHRWLIMPLGAAIICLAVLPGDSLQAQSTATAEQTSTPDAKPKPALSAKQKPAKSPEFVRVHKKDKTPLALQTAVATYVPDPTKASNSGEHPSPADVEVTLIGAVHIGSPEYYGKLNDLFQKYDALLYELVADPALGIPDPSERGMSPISTIQVGMKEALGLAFQLDLIDYRAKNFVHADLTPDEFFAMLESRKEGMMQLFFRSLGAGIAMQSSGKTNDLELMSALMAENQQVAVRRAMAEQMGTMDGQMAAITGDDGKSTLITERNAKAFEVLKREMDAGKKSFGVFYGAGHLKDMHQRLIDDFGLKLSEVTWLDAWDLTE